MPKVFTTRPEELGFTVEEFEKLADAPLSAEQMDDLYPMMLDFVERRMKAPDCTDINEQRILMVMKIQLDIAMDLELDPEKMN